MKGKEKRKNEGKRKREKINWEKYEGRKWNGRGRRKSKMGRE